LQDGSEEEKGRIVEESRRVDEGEMEFDMVADGRTVDDSGTGPEGTKKRKGICSGNGVNVFSSQGIRRREDI